MDTFQLNKLLMAVLGTLFIVFAISFMADAIYHAETPEQQGFEIAVAEGEGEGESTASDAPAYEPIAPLLAEADIDAGQSVFKKCASCHTIEQGGQNKVGPNLYDVVGRPIASVEGFGYSSALISYGEGKEWSYAELNGFLHKPKEHVPGTSMGFAGLKKTEDRANLVAWLRTQSASPPPLPEAGAEDEAAGETATSEGETTTDENAEAEAASDDAATESDTESSSTSEGAAESDTASPDGGEAGSDATDTGETESELESGN